MSEVAAIAFDRPQTPSPRLARETGRIAARLAELVAVAGEGDPMLADAVRFLRVRGDTLEGPGDPLVPEPIDRLVAALGLTPVELDLLLLAGLAEEHEGYAAALRRIHPAGEPYATAGLAARLCSVEHDRARVRALLERGTAVVAGALVVDAEGPFFERSLRLGDALWSALHGIDAWPAGVRVADGPAVMDGLDEWLASAQAVRAARSIAARVPVTVLVTADSVDVAAGRAAALVESAGVTSARLVLHHPGGAETMRLLGVHALVRDCVPVVVQPTRVEQPAEPVVLDPGDHPGPVVVCGPPGVAVAHGARPVLSVPAGPLSASARRRMWQALLPELAHEAPGLAARIVVEPPVAAEAATDVRMLRAIEGRPASAANVLESVRTRAGVSLSAGVKLVRPTATWAQLVLRPDRLAQLEEALDRLRHQSVVLDDWGFLAGRPGARGVRLLFAGPPGTGKTLSAEILAGALGVDLLVVDISRVVSKWIGETEKNLAEVFDTAERSGAVLFFDEADALFGRRTEVSDAHDRYANLETAYLLARLERFDGLAVLATNLRANIDPAFTRRLEFAVDYEEPAAAEREALWRCHLPDGAPVAADVDLRQLAHLYAVTGGVIRNAATAAGFLAAAEGTPIARRHLVHAVRREYEKAGRAFPGEPTATTPRGRSNG
jgi:ATPase family associated with various cellular activities (AAA)